MVSPVIVKVEGLQQLEAALKVAREQLGVKTGGVIIRGLRAGAKLIRADAKLRAPLGTTLRPVGKPRKRKDGSTGQQRFRRGGLLKANIVEHAIATGSRIAGGKPTVIVRVRNHGYTRRNGKIFINRPGSSPGYWWFVEFGTSRNPARPFLRPAFEAQKERAVTQMRDHVATELSRIFGKAFKKAA
jgi:HK97 gp10 family phage protein